MRTDDTDRSSAGPDARLARLEAELATARAEIVELRRRVEVEPGSAALSRRRLLLGAAAAAAGAGAALADAAPVAAAGALTTEVTNTAFAPTQLMLDSATARPYVFAASDNGLALSGRTGSLVGHAQGAATFVGVLGLAQGLAATAVMGDAEQVTTGGVGVEGVGATGVHGRVPGTATGPSGTPWSFAGVHGVANLDAVPPPGSAVAGVLAASLSGFGLIAMGRAGALHLVPVVATAPPARGQFSVGGVIDGDGAGGLWHCVATGTPGKWRQLSGPDTAGAFHAITPTRVYDTRAAAPSPGRLVAGESRQVSVADGRDLTTGAVTVSGLVPDGATAITCNVTVVATAGAGFVTVNPGGVTTVSAATVNWSAAGQILNNGVVAAIAADRTVTMVVGGTGASTDVVIDVTGYFR